MLGRTEAIRVWARGRPTDLRLGFQGLAGLVVSEFGADPRGGDLYLFVNRRRDAARVLLWDGSGLCLYAKKLALGRFVCLWRADGERGGPLRLTTTELNLFLDGAAQHGRVRLAGKS